MTGFGAGGGYTIVSTQFDMFDDVARRLPDDFSGTIDVPKEKLMIRTSAEVAKRFIEYLKYIRDSLRNIKLEIEKQKAVTDIIYSETFWRNFIQKIVKEDRTEDSVWDVKSDLEIWNLKHKKREEAEVEFCEQVASYANANGGVMIVGVTDKSPRTVVGVGKMEERRQATRRVLDKRLQRTEFIKLREIVMADGKKCMAIIIAQTRSPISVKYDDGKISYPMRSESGLVWKDHDHISGLKSSINEDNYLFVKTLQMSSGL